MDGTTPDPLRKKVPLAFLPTPLTPLKKLSAELGPYELYIKRDDMTGLGMGGNKTRKLEYLLYDAAETSCDLVITSGAQQSNHCRQTAAACAQLGLECHLLLGGVPPKVYEGNLLLSHLFGAQLHFTGENRKGEDIAELHDVLSKKGKCYLIPYGGSNAMGALGFVNAMREVKIQLQKMDLQIDHIFFSSSSGGTQAGMLLGKELFDIQADLHAISVDKAKLHGESLEERILDILATGSKSLNLTNTFQIGDIALDRDYEGPGYANLTQQELKTIEMLAESEGILLDAVYTARAFHGMLDLIQKDRLAPGSKILFWHTGGMPNLLTHAFANRLNR
ncbi:MAG: D-cysteine desulfhydrase family protein [Muricauda sp. TMED12]|nr:MAG: D-cysteine desulfhydrase family protein [Muricauda sp. TMED12]